MFWKMFLIYVHVHIMNYHKYAYMYKWESRKLLCLGDITGRKTWMDTLNELVWPLEGASVHSVSEIELD